MQALRYTCDKRETNLVADYGEKIGQQSWLNASMQVKDKGLQLQPYSRMR